MDAPRAPHADPRWRRLLGWALVWALGCPAGALGAPDGGAARDAGAGNAGAGDAGAGDAGAAGTAPAALPGVGDQGAQMARERTRQGQLEAELAQERAALDIARGQIAANAQAVEVLGAAEAEFAAREAPAAPQRVDQRLLAQVEAEAAARQQAEVALTEERQQLEASRAALPSLDDARTGQRTAQALSRALGEELLTAPPGPTRAGLELRARTARLAADVARARVERIAAQRDQMQAALALLGRKIELARQRVRWHGRRVELYQAAHERTLAAERLDTTEALAEAKAALERAVDPTERFFAAGRVQLIESRLGRAVAAESRGVLSRRLKLQSKVLEAERAEYAGLESLVSRDAAGARTARQLQDAFQRLDRRRDELAGLHKHAEGATLHLRSRRLDVATALFALDTDWDPVGDRLDPDRLGAADAQREAVRDALTAEADALAEALGVGEKMLVVIGDREAILGQLDRLIRGRIFWVQDAPPLGAATVSAAAREGRALLRWVAEPDTWAPDARGSVWPLLWIGVVGGVLTLLMLGVYLRLRRWRRRVDREAAEVPLWQLIVGAVARAAVAPAWLWLIAGLVGLTALSATVRIRLSHGLSWLALLAALAAAERLMLQREGAFAEALHLTDDSRQSLRRASRAVLLGALLCVVPRGVLAAAEPHADALGRLLYTAFEGVVLVSLVGVLRPRASVARDLLDYVGRPAVTRFAGPVWLGLSIFGLVVMGMDVAGYRYGAAWLSGNVLASLGVVGTLLLLWRPLNSRLAARLGDLLSDDPAPEHGQARARRLIGVVLVLIGALSLAGVWDVNSQALAFLDAVVLYHMGTEPVTGADALGAVVALIISGWVVRSLPRLMAITMFRYVDIDNALQFAVVTIARYALLALGVVIAFDALHIDLSKLGWLVAAVGVGLGFGLQEIVANFISGIILLMERPIRIGDWIGIGGIEGRVKHISIRATTLQTLDRQEIIVPNKDFITREVVNWTLTDGVVRLTVNIGVAYGTDVERVRALLVDVARGEPRVCAEPPPTAILFDHADSALHFQLNVHHRDPAQRNPLRGALNAAINRKLTECGIEIPFPQRDLHIRSGLEALDPKRLSEGEPRG